MKKGSIVNGIVIILTANILNMFIGLITGFILPKYLSVDSYATIKTYQLYLSVIGVFHFGYSDGIYLRYGGKELTQINKLELAELISTFRIFQLSISIIFFIIAVLLKNTLLVIFSIDLTFYNLLDFFKRINQAVGNYKMYANITNYTTVAYFLINISLIFFLNSNNAYLYILGYVVVDLFVWLIAENRIRKNCGFFLNKFSLKELVNNIREGIALLFGNLTSIILTGMDRWFTKVLLTTLDFAQYSFAVSVENMLNVAITPISVTMYNYLCRCSSKEQVNQLKSYIVVFSVFLVSAFFPVKFILEIYLPNYLGAIFVIAFLFASQMFYIVIKSVYVNLYKARHQQKKYLIKLLMVIAIGAVFNSIFFLVYPKKESFAFGTLCSAIVWFIICQHDFKEAELNLSEWAYIIFQIVAFLLFAFDFRAIVGFIGYTFTTLLFTLLFMRKTFVGILNMGFEWISARIRK